MIPKIIHYCWFGRGKMPEYVQNYISSWKKNCPGFTIKQWNEDTFDLNLNQYAKEAYFCKKYAFVTDFVRLYALFTEGGIYMDTDVEVLKPLDVFLDNQAFSGFEDVNFIPTGIIGAEKGNKWIEQELEYYRKAHFINNHGALNLQTNVCIMTAHALQHKLIPNGTYQVLDNGLTIFPKDYFCPKSYDDGSLKITDNTHTIHHFAGSWLKEDRVLTACKHHFGEVWGTRVWKIRNLLYKFIAVCHL